VKSYFVRRLGVAVITFFLASILIFFIIQLPPGDFVTYAISQSGDSAGSAQVAEKMRQQYGLDRPVYEQYFRWIGGVVRGDLGYSFLYKKPVMELIKSEFLWTVIITGISFVLAWAAGMFIGIYSALHKYSIGDHVFTFLGFLGLSIPPFFLALILIYLLISSGYGIAGGLFSSQFVNAPWSLEKVMDLMKHIWIPIAAISLSNITEVMRIMRGSMIEVMSQPYIMTARAKGLKKHRVIIRHAVRIAMNPLISLAGLLAPKLISGIVVTAVVLNLPVMGPTFIQALKSQDMYLAGAYLLLTVILLLAGNLIADLALGWSDPRIRLDSK